MEEVELRDYLKIVLKRKKIVIFTTLIFIIMNSLATAFFIRPGFKASAKLRIANYAPQEREAVLERYRAHDIVSEVKDKLKLAYLPATPDLAITADNILEITFFNKNPKDAVAICNAYLNRIQTEEIKKYEKNKNYLEAQIKLVKEELMRLKNERDAIKLSNPQRIRQMELRADDLRGELKICNERLLPLVEPIILMPALNAKLIGLSWEMGMLLSAFIGLAIGINLAFIIEYLKFEIKR